MMYSHYNGNGNPEEISVKVEVSSGFVFPSESNYTPISLRRLNLFCSGLSVFLLILLTKMYEVVKRGEHLCKTLAFCYFLTKNA